MYGLRSDGINYTKSQRMVNLRMNHTQLLYTTKNTSLMIPKFTAENGTKKEEENVKRMNSFYDELKRSVIAYSESSDFPEGGKYFAKANVTDDNDVTTVRMEMRLRCKGATVSHRSLVHRWEDGVITRKLTE